MHSAHPNHAFNRVGDIELIHAVTLIASSSSAVPNVSVLLQEALRDFVNQLGVCMHLSSGHFRNYSVAFAEARMVAHEIAHQFGIAGETPGTLLSIWYGADCGFVGEQVACIRGSTKLGEE